MLLASQPFYNFDVESYSVVAGIVRQGGNVYAETDRYNYSPVWFNLLNLLSYLPVVFPFAVRGFLSVVDVFNGFLLQRALGARAAILYWLSPVAILIVGYQGQFDTLSATPLLLAMAFCQSPRARAAWQSWTLAVLSILIKHLLVFGAWTLLVYRYGLRKAAVLFVLAGGILALSFVPYLPDGAGGILQNVILYHSISTNVGLGTLPPAVAFPIFAVAMIGVPFVAQRLKLNENEALGLSAVALIVFLPGTSPQYWIIVSIFGLSLLNRLGLDRWYAAFTVVTTVALLGVYAVFATYLPWIWISVMVLVWLACIAGLIMIYRAARTELLSNPARVTSLTDDQHLADSKEAPNGS